MLCALTSCVIPAGPIEGPTQESIAASRKIAPPGGIGSNSDSAGLRGDRETRSLSDLPEEVRDSDGEIVMDSSVGPHPEFADEQEKRRRESYARRTDNELIGTTRSMDERHARDLGAIDRDLGLVPQERGGPGPSYTLGLQRIKNLYREQAYEDALIETNELLRFYPRSAQLLSMKGTLHQRLGQLDLALAAYEKAFQKEPTRKLEAQIRYLKNVLQDRARLAHQKASTPTDSENASNVSDDDASAEGAD